MLPLYISVQFEAVEVYTELVIRSCPANELGCLTLFFFFERLLDNVYLLKQIMPQL
jgi:hypothetical protein